MFSINDYKPKEKKQLKMEKCADVLIDSPLKHPFVKRFKSMYKIALNSLNLCTNMMLRKTSFRADIKEVSKEIQEMAKSFNQNYYVNKEEYSDELYKGFKNELSDLYCKIEEVSKKNYP